MYACNNGLAAGPAQLQLLLLAFLVVLAGLKLAGLDGFPVLGGHLIDDLQAPGATGGDGPGLRKIAQRHAELVEYFTG
jgi:hypothetical protein